MKNAAKQYQKNQILTAPKEELLIMLLDGAVRFATQARRAMKEENHEEACGLYIRAQRIMIELITALRSDMLEEKLYANLVSLYFFVYQKLVEANMKKEEKPVDEALQILGHLRETWVVAVDQARKEKFPQAKLVAKAEEEQGQDQGQDKPPPKTRVDFSS